MTVGTWTARLLGGVLGLLSLVVTQQQPAHFALADPDARSFTPEPAQLAALQCYVCEWLPGADADALEPVSCTYTTTANENFSLDRVGPVVVGVGFSGHGFKFTPAVGRILADLVTTNFSAPNLFALSR